MRDINTLFRTHHVDLQTFLRRRGFAHDTAADLSQDAFVRLLSAKPSKELIDAQRYLFRIAINLSVDLVRKQVNSSIAEDSEAILKDIADDRPTPEQILASRQELAIILEALAEVPVRPRTIFLDRMAGKTFAEVGTAHGVSLKTAFSHTMKVTLFLKSRLDTATNISSASSENR